MQLGNLKGRSLTAGLKEPLQLLEKEPDLDLFFSPDLVGGRALVIVTSSEPVEKSLNLEADKSLSTEDRPEGGKRGINLMFRSVEGLLEVFLEVSELPSYPFSLKITGLNSWYCAFPSIISIS